MECDESCSAGGPPPHPDDIYRPDPSAAAKRERQKAIAAFDRAASKVASYMQPSLQPKEPA